MRPIAAAVIVSLIVGACAADTSKPSRSGREFPQVLYNDYTTAPSRMLTLDLENCRVKLYEGSSGGTSAVGEGYCSEGELTSGRQLFSEPSRAEYRSAALGESGFGGEGGLRSVDVPPGEPCEDCTAPGDAGLPSGGGGGFPPYRRVTVWPPTGLSESYSFGSSVAGRSADMLGYLDALHAKYRE